MAEYVSYFFCWTKILFPLRGWKSDHKLKIVRKKIRLRFDGGFPGYVVKEREPYPANIREWTNFSSQGDMANSYPISVLLNGNIDLHHLYSQLHTKAVCVYKTPLRQS
jgi:hypothetical protein